ncbi:molecular chaperone [Shewanella algae]|uniref:fimbrial biogenesis chaperone n=1 Tax=Shewanella algae TaxID=38313 RepID=UPI001AAC5ACF|nr:molecular chaperone [Shewanella algae]MBO2605422.1 molecular chaperone [Shewanella algae]
MNVKHVDFYGFFILFCSFVFIVSTKSFAGVSLDSSRVIFHSDNSTQQINLVNANDYPVIVQIWVNDGGFDISSEDASYVPVIPVPAIFNLSPRERRSINLIRIRDDMPVNMESLYWFNIYEIPPHSNSSLVSENVMVVTMQTQYKLFFRPDFIKEKITKVGEYIKLNWCDGKLKINNQGPFYLTITRIELDNHTPPLQPQMLAPFSSDSLELPIKPSAQSASIYYLDDYGVEQLWKVAL